MTELTSAERVLRVLQRQEPDRVPHFEWPMDRKKMPQAGDLCHLRPGVQGLVEPAFAG